jgi:hypothetical protein
VEHVVGSGGNDIVTLSNTANGLTVDLGAGTNTLNLAAGINSIAATPGSSLFINGTASQDSLTFSNTANGQFVDLGAGGNDTLVLTSTSLNFITVANIENVVGSAGVDDIVIANTAGPTTVTGGLGVDHITASAGQDNFRFTSVADSTSGAADNITNVNAGGDTFTFSGMTIAGSNIQYVDIGSFAANGQASAHLQNVSPGNDLLQIDINGDGVMNANDIEVHLTSLAGTLSNSNFVLI